MGRRVIVPDVRGRGQSDRDPNPTNYQPKIYARDMVEMMAALDIPRAVFLGTSMGGLITMTLMAIRPKAIAAAILNDVGPAIAPEGIARILGYAGKGPTSATGTMPPIMSAGPTPSPFPISATRIGTASPSARSARDRRAGAGL